jgi:hypothetical protein
MLVDSLGISFGRCLLFYVYVYGCCFIMFYIVCCIQNTIFKSSNSFLIFVFVSVLLYVKVVRLVFCVVGHCSLFLVIIIVM